MWGAISRRGPTSIAIFEGIMDSTFYQEILRRKLLPFIRDKYPEGHRFQQDVSRSTRQWLEDNNVNYWPTPPESPDMNPIENLWHQIKEHLRRHVKPSTKDELINGIQDYWNDHITVELCNRYIDHMHKVLPAVRDCEGFATGF